MAVIKKIVTPAPVYEEALHKAVGFKKAIITKSGNVICPTHQVMLEKQIADQEVAFINYHYKCPLPNCHSVFSFSERKQS